MASSIKQKTGTCPQCVESGDSKIKPLIAGLCASFHYKLHRQKECAARKKPISKTKSSGQTLSQWFLEQREKMVGKCCSCGSVSPKNSDTYFTFGIAHIFPKSIFESIKTHPLNWIELCSKCHNLADRDIDTFGSMKCFPVAVEKFKIMEPDITERHKYLDLFKNKAIQLGYYGQQ